MKTCMYCNRPIADNEIAVEISDSSHSEDTGSTVSYMHGDCEEALQKETYDYETELMQEYLNQKGQ